MIQALSQKLSVWAAITLLISFTLLIIIIGMLVTQSPMQILPDQNRNTAPHFAINTVTQLYRLEAQSAQSGWAADGYIQSGNLRRQMGDLPGAMAQWEAVTNPPESLQWQLFDAYITLDQWTDAAKVLSDIIRQNPDSTQAHYQLGLLLAAYDPLNALEHLHASQTEESIAANIMSVLTERSDDLQIGIHVGQIFADAELWQYAELAFRQAAIVNFPYPEALAYVGLSREQQGKSGSAWIQQALHLGSDVSQVQYIYGLHLRRQNEYEASRDAFVQAVSLSPENPAYYAELGTAYRLLLDYEQAEYWLRVAVSVSQNAPEFQELLAVFYAEEGYRLPPESLESAQQSRQQLPADPDLMAGIGWALHTMGDTAGGLAEINAALELAPENPAALFYKARILADTGDLQAAVEIMARVAASNSEYAPEAQRQINEWTIGISTP